MAFAKSKSIKILGRFGSLPQGCPQDAAYLRCQYRSITLSPTCLVLPIQSSWILQHHFPLFTMTSPDVSCIHISQCPYARPTAHPTTSEMPMICKGSESVRFGSSWKAPTCEDVSASEMPVRHSKSTTFLEVEKFNWFRWCSTWSSGDSYGFSEYEKNGISMDFFPFIVWKTRIGWFTTALQLKASKFPFFELNPVSCLIIKTVNESFLWIF